jgi:hypothetical protein
VLDQVRTRLTEDGLPTCGMVRGTLPLGHGFASSTTLTLLHLGGHPAESVKSIVDGIDKQVHGFPPSGVDYYSIAAGKAGYFGPGGWRPADRPRRLAASAVLVRDQSDWPLSETRGRVVAAADKLIPIANHLCSALRARAILDYQALFDYAVQLRRIGVYTPRAAAIVDHVLGHGVVAKGVGGLTNKAVIIVWRPGMRLPVRRRILRELRSYGADAVLGRI